MASKVKSKNKLKLAFGGKNKEEKKEMKKEEKPEKVSKVPELLDIRNFKTELV